MIPSRRISLLFESLFAPICVGCGTTVPPGRAPLCRVCEVRLRKVPAPRCRRCGYTRFAELASPGVCAECENWPEFVQRAEAAFLFEPPAVQLVHGLKYSGWISLAPRLGALMREAARRIEPEYAVLVPVPLAPARLRERGFNQARLLAEGLGSALGWPVRDILERRRPGAVQARSGRRKRAANVAGAYRVRPKLLSDLQPTAGSLEPPVVLVDDVITTGATIAACAAALDTADIACAGAVSFARTPPRVPGT